MKSGRLKTRNDKIYFDVEWPQMHVKRSNATAPAYLDLSIPEFVAGCLRVLELDTPRNNLTAPFLDNIMYLRNQMDECS